MLRDAARSSTVPILIAGLALGAAAWAAWSTTVLNDNVASRLATVYSLMHDGTWYIDRPVDIAPNPFEPLTIDKVQIGDRLVSSKPPLLPLAMAGLYVPLRAAGLDLDDRAAWRTFVRWYTAVFAIAPYAGLLLAGWAWGRRLVSQPDARTGWFAAYALALPTLAFAGTLNNHIPASAALVAGAYMAHRIWNEPGPPRPRDFVWTGFLSSLVFVLDMPLTVFPALWCAALLLRFPKRTLAYLVPAGAIVPALQAGLFLWVTGAPVPVQLRPALYLYEASFWRNPGGLDALNEPKGLYAFHMLLGRFGTFSLYPVTLLGVAAIVATVRGGLRDRGWIAAFALGFAIVTLYYVTRTNNYGGAAYGFRWQFGAMTLLLIAGAPLLARWQARAPWIGFALAAVVSAYSTYEALRSPWGEGQEWTVRTFLGMP